MGCFRPVDEIPMLSMITYHQCFWSMLLSQRYLFLFIKSRRMEEWGFKGEMVVLRKPIPSASGNIERKEKLWLTLNNKWKGGPYEIASSKSWRVSFTEGKIHFFEKNCPSIKLLIKTAFGFSNISTPCKFDKRGTDLDALFSACLIINNDQF